MQSAYPYLNAPRFPKLRFEYFRSQGWMYPCEPVRGSRDRTEDKEGSKRVVQQASEGEYDGTCCVIQGASEADPKVSLEFQGSNSVG